MRGKIGVDNCLTNKISRAATRVADPDPVFKFLRIRFQPRFWNKKKDCRKVSKSDLSEENLKIMTKDHKKIDGKFSRQRCLDPDPVCPERLDQDPVNIRPDPKPCLKECFFSNA